jgi:hypothetical protein
MVATVEQTPKGSNPDLLPKDRRNVPYVSGSGALQHRSRPRPKSPVSGVVQPFPDVPHVNGTSQGAKTPLTYCYWFTFRVEHNS